MSRTAFDADGSTFPMMGERVWSRAAIEAGSRAFPMREERAVNRTAFEADGSAFPTMGGACTEPLGLSGWQQHPSREGVTRGATQPSRLATAPSLHGGDVHDATRLTLDFGGSTFCEL